MDKVDMSDAEKSEWIKVEFFMDLDNPASKYSWHFAIFNDGCPEECIKCNWLMCFCDIDKLIALKFPDYKTRVHYGEKTIAIYDLF
jgi:hypothetical protein